MLVFIYIFKLIKSTWYSRTGTPREKLEWAFNLYDINNDNELSIKEIVQIIIATQRFNIHLNHV